MSRDVPSHFPLVLGTTDERASLDGETTTLLRACSSRLRSILRRRFGEEVAEDATQEAFSRLYRARRGGTHIDNPEAWLVRVAQNAALDQVRDVRLEVPLTDELFRSLDAHERPVETPEQICWQQQRLARLKQEISMLSDVERTCLFMRAEGSTFQAIGTHVGMDYRRVAELLQRVIKRLRGSVSDVSLPSQLND